MTTIDRHRCMLYRTPNVIIDRHEWHAIVRLHNGRTALVYRWRPLSTRSLPWSPMTEWQGPKPKGIGDRFWRYRGHIREAMDSEALRRMALGKLRGPATAAEQHNRELAA